MRELVGSFALAELPVSEPASVVCFPSSPTKRRVSGHGTLWLFLLGEICKRSRLMVAGQD